MIPNKIFRKLRNQIRRRAYRGFVVVEDEFKIVEHDMRFRKKTKFDYMTHDQFLDHIFRGIKTRP